MKKISLRHIGFFSLAAFAVLLTDRLIKYYILNFLNQKIVIFKDIFEIVYQQNAGVAFGINLPYAVQLTLFPLLVVAGIYIIAKNLDYNKLFVLIVTGFIFGAALSNFIDRLIYGSVIDYISVSIYPVFNLADAFITVGIFILLVFYGKIKKVIK